MGRLRAANALHQFLLTGIIGRARCRVFVGSRFVGAHEQVLIAKSSSLGQHCKGVLWQLIGDSYAVPNDLKQEWNSSTARSRSCHALVSVSGIVVVTICSGCNIKSSSSVLAYLRTAALTFAAVRPMGGTMRYL